MVLLPRISSLNGWWDYAPANTAGSESAVPEVGWAEKRYLVPSLVDKSLAGVRRRGETFYHEHLNADPAAFCDGEHEFLFDNHDYPVEWMAARSGWARRELQVEPLAPGHRRFLRLDAVAGRGEVWINGRRVAVHDDAFLPQEIDVTTLLHDGQNEVAVLIRDYERLRDDSNKTLTPSGNMMTAHMRGIWQDVWLIERGGVFVSDVTVRTSVRKKALTVIVEVTNACDQAADVYLVMDVAPWVRGGDVFDGASELALPAQKLTVSAGETVLVEVGVPWADAKLWQPESPHLYWLRSRVECGRIEIDRRAERFGFREVWIEGPDILLNGFPVHLFSDWGHKLNQLHHTGAWNRCWFAMMKAENFNHSRLHTHPHPEFILDLADEEGILLTGETAIHGSGGEQAADEDGYWRAAEAHIRAFVRRDKNHPSLLLWSVANEMRWNQDKTDLTKRRLPELRELFRRLDPTREAYHEGDSSLWNEHGQAIMSRHYGKECGDYGWWDKRRPLHAGEMSAYHYMGPTTNFHTGGGDGLWADYRRVVERMAAFDGPLPAGFDLVLLERDVVTPGSHQNRWVEDYLRRGGRLLVLEQKHSLFPGVALESKAQIHGFPRAYGHPVLAGFTQEDLQFWGEDPYAAMNSDAHIAHRLYQKGDECLLQPLVDAGEGGFGLKLPEWIALGELRIGAGRLLASQFRFAEKGASIPEAGRLFAAMLDDLLADIAKELPRFVEAEVSDVPALNNALAGAREGGVSWIRLRNREGITTFADKLGIRVTAVEETHYHAVRESDDPALSGISHVDVSGLDGMTYCFGAESLPVARLAIEPDAAIEALLVTPTAAYLEEQHIHGQRVEALRAHGASRFLFAEAPRKRILLGRIRHGKGWLYFDTFLKPAESHPRLRRFESLFRRNFGVEPPVHALTGDAVPDAVPSSPGFPTQICLQPAGPPERRAVLIASTALPAERMAPSTMFRLGGWKVLDDENGELPLETPGEAALFTCLHSPRTRKIVMEDSGIPNPESLTFLDIAAPQGTVEVVINGASLGQKAIESGRATFSDIELAQAFNQVLLLWSGGRPGERLHFRFRDIMQAPETDLLFLRCNTEATEWTQQEF